MNRHLVSAVVVVALSFAGCGKKSDDPIKRVAADDPRMNAAIARARSTVQTFIAALGSAGHGRSHFSIKVPFTEGGNTEHFWLAPVTYHGTQFTGTVDNDPEMVKSVKIGQRVTVAPDQISDWMYIDHRKLVGGETLRVLRAAMSPAERADFDKSVPFTVD